jgi:hypothetical protein
MSMDPWLDRFGGHSQAEQKSCVCWSLAWQALRAQPSRVNIVQCCAGFGGVVSKAEIVQGWGAQPSEMELLQGCVGLGNLAGKAEIAQGWGAWPSKMEFLQGCAGLGSLAGKAEIAQGWGVWPSEMELLQGCAGLGVCGLANIINICGSLALRFLQQRSCRSEGWEF